MALINYIFLAIGGTSSKESREDINILGNTESVYIKSKKTASNSHVLNLYLDFNPSNLLSKKFIDGPSDAMLGHDVFPIVKQAMDFISSEIKKKAEDYILNKIDINVLDLEKKKKKIYTDLQSSGTLSNDSVKKIMEIEKIEKQLIEMRKKKYNEYTSKYIRVILIGHSRGGAACIYIANEFYKLFGIKIYFMGLYDAVDMVAASFDTSKIQENVEFTYHAKRNKIKFPRSVLGKEWSNAAEEMRSSKNYIEEIFDTTHAGMDGHPDYSIKTLGQQMKGDLGVNDLGCMVEVKIQISMEGMIPKFEKYQDKRIAQVCKSASFEVDQAMRKQMKAKNIEVSGTTLVYQDY